MNVMFSKAPTKFIMLNLRIAQLRLSVVQAHFWKIFSLTQKISDFLRKSIQEENKLSFTSSCHRNVTVNNKNLILNYVVSVTDKNYY
jgi:hypothetical protein